MSYGNALNKLAYFRSLLHWHSKYEFLEAYDLESTLN